MDDYEYPRIVPGRTDGEDLPFGTRRPPSLVRPYAELSAHTVESPLPADTASDAPAEPGDEVWGPLSGGGRQGGPGRKLMRRLTHGPVRGLRAVRAVTAGGGAVAVVLLLMAVVLHQTGAWPFARDDGAAERSVPDARLPLPPSVVGSGGSPSGSEDDEDGDQGRSDEDGQSGGGDEDRPGQSPSPPAASMPAPGGGGGPTANCGCRATWHVDSQGEDFNAMVRVVNTERQPVRAWRITWTWPAGQRLVKGWNAGFRESGGVVTVRNGDGNSRIPAGGETTFGLQAAGGGSPAPRLVCHVL